MLQETPTMVAVLMLSSTIRRLGKISRREQTSKLAGITLGSLLIRIEQVSRSHLKHGVNTYHTTNHSSTSQQAIRNVVHRSLGSQDTECCTDKWNLPDMTSDTPKTPITFKTIFMTVLPSMKDRVCLLVAGRLAASTRSILIDLSSLGSRRTMFAYNNVRRLFSATEREGSVRILTEGSIWQMFHPLLHRRRVGRL